MNERISDHKRKRFIPIDMWINMIGVENFDFEVLETTSLEELDEKEKYYIDLYNSTVDGYNKQEGGYNNAMGEGNGRARLSYDDIIFIRTAYNDHVCPKEVYELFKNRISLS